MDAIYNTTAAADPESASAPKDTNQQQLKHAPNPPPTIAPTAQVTTTATAAVPGHQEGVTPLATNPPVATTTTATISPPKPTKHLKTPEQKLALERAFQEDNFLNEISRPKLANETGLSEQQIATWFNHRRRRSKRESEEGVLPSTQPLHPSGGALNTTNRPAPITTEEASRIQKRKQEYEALLEAAKKTLPVPYSENGPQLGYAFDTPPSRATETKFAAEAAALAASGKRKRSLDDQEDPDFILGGVGGGVKQPRPTLQSMDRSFIEAQARMQLERLEANMRREQQRLEKEKEKANSKMVKEREKALARMEAEQKKHYERLLREQKKEEERKAKEEAKLKAMQEKEERRLALVREREMKAEERKREKDEKKKERDAMRALTQQERNAMRLRNRETGTAPKDDLDIEWMDLMKIYRRENNIPDDATIPVEGSAPPEGCGPLPERPPFPPSAIGLSPIIVGHDDSNNGGTDGVDNETVGRLLSSCSVLSTLHEMLALDPPMLDELFTAICEGSANKLLTRIHIALIRLLHADAEEAHGLEGSTSHPHLQHHHHHASGGTTGATAAGGAAADGSGANAALADLHVLTTGAHLLDEAWAWGFDVDSWRAHLNPLTWPEIARQLAISAGLGRRRPLPRQENKKMMGVIGEDVVMGTGPDQFELSLPARLGGPGTIKGAAWMVLKEAGPEGLHVDVIARRIQHRGLRDLRTTKAPESSIAGALAKDVLFERTQPATFALQSVIALGAKLSNRGAGRRVSGGGLSLLSKTKGKRKEGHGGEICPEGDYEEERGEGNEKKEDTPVKGEMDNANTEEEDHQPGEDEEEEEEEEEKRRQREAHEGEPWVAALLLADYNDLPLHLRISMLCTLCQLALDSPTARDVIDRRLEEQQRIRKVLYEEERYYLNQIRQLKVEEQGLKAKAEYEAAKMMLEKAGAHAGGGDGDAEKVEGKQGTPGHGDRTGDPPVAANVAAGDMTIAEQTTQGVTPASIAATIEEIQKKISLKKEASRTERESNAVRLEPLGMDRRYNKYWRFVAPLSVREQGDTDDTGVERDVQRHDGRIVVERGEDGTLCMLCSAHDVQKIIDALDRRGPREKDLFASLVRYKSETIKGLGRSMAVDPLTVTSTMALSLSDVGQAFATNTMAWQELNGRGGMDDSTSAKPVEPAPGTLQPFVPGESPVMTKLKAELLAIHAAIPSQAFYGNKIEQDEERDTEMDEDVDADADVEKDSQVEKKNKAHNDDMLINSTILPFDSAAWTERVTSASSLSDIKSALGALESALLPLFLHPDYKRDPLLVKGAWIPTGDEVATALPGSTAADILLFPGSTAQRTSQQEHGNNTGELSRNDSKEKESLAWLPATAAAISLRLCALDASVKYGGADASAAREVLEGYRYILRPGIFPEGNDGLVQCMPLREHGRIKPVFFPPFQYHMLFAPRSDFSFPVVQFKTDVEACNDATILMPASKKSVGGGAGGVAATGGGGGRGGRAARGRGRGRGGRGGGGRAEKEDDAAVVSSHHPSAAPSAMEEEEDEDGAGGGSDVDVD